MMVMMTMIIHPNTHKYTHINISTFPFELGMEYMYHKCVCVWLYAYTRLSLYKCNIKNNISAILCNVIKM